MEGYKGLQVYEKSFGLVIRVYECCKKLPKEETFGISGQMRRAAVSVPLNIAEGYAKKTYPLEYRRFLVTARGSCNEMEVLADLCLALGYISKEENEKLMMAYDEVRRMLQGIINKLTDKT